MPSKEYMYFDEEFELFQTYHRVLWKCLSELKEREVLLGDAIKKDNIYVDPIAIELVNDAYYYAELMEEHCANAMNIRQNFVCVDTDQLFEMKERTQLIQFHIANMKRQMEGSAFICIDTYEETVLYYSNNELERLAEGLNLFMVIRK
ncbi:hypothetical protein [Lysinibacillus sp. LZ02]|uniref:hypothetical protein n=1 Tax=Lysinibacillus sp. LZ02 TaxID=3420668 RepID=UPI003D35BDE6